MHSLAQFSRCAGVLAAPDQEEPDTERLAFSVGASYTDAGAPGVLPLTTRALHTLQPRRKQAEHFTRSQGVLVQPSADTGGGGDDVYGFTEGYLTFSPVNLTNITGLSLRLASFSSGGVIEFRVDAPDGPLVGSAPLMFTGDYVTLPAPLADPGGTRELFLVFALPEGGEVYLNWIEFDGPGVSFAVPPVLQQAGDVGGPFEDVTGAALDLANGELTVPRPATTTFYRLRAGAPLRITDIVIRGPDVAVRFE
jgi:hypothetical protein